MSCSEIRDGPGTGGSGNEGGREGGGLTIGEPRIADEVEEVGVRGGQLRVDGVRFNGGVGICDGGAGNASNSTGTRAALDDVRGGDVRGVGGAVDCTEGDLAGLEVIMDDANAGKVGEVGETGEPTDRCVERVDRGEDDGEIFEDKGKGGELNARDVVEIMVVVAVISRNERKSRAVCLLNGTEKRLLEPRSIPGQL